MLRKTNSGLREVINTQAVQIETLTGQIDALSARIAELERRLGSDSTTSSKPPSSDPPYRNPNVAPRAPPRAAGPESSPALVGRRCRWSTTPTTPTRDPDPGPCGCPKLRAQP